MICGLVFAWTVMTVTVIMMMAVFFVSKLNNIVAAKEPSRERSMLLLLPKPGIRVWHSYIDRSFVALVWPENNKEHRAAKGATARLHRHSIRAYK